MAKSREKKITIEVINNKVEYHAVGLSVYEMIGLLTSYKNVLEVENLRGFVDVEEPVKKKFKNEKMSPKKTIKTKS